MISSLALLLVLAGIAPAHAGGPSFQDISAALTFDYQHTDVNRDPTGQGVNHFRGDPENAEFVSYIDGGKITSFVGRNRNIVLVGNNSKKSNAGSTVHLDLAAGLACAEDGGASVVVDIDDLAGCDPCVNTAPLFPASRFGTPTANGGLPDNFDFAIHGEDYDDLLINCEVETNARLIFAVGGEEWELWWGPFKRPGGWTYNPDSDPIKVRRVSNSEWRFQTTGNHLAALYRVNNSPHRPTEYHGQFIVRFSGTSVAISDPGTTPTVDEHCNIQMVLGLAACVPAVPAPTVTITSPEDGSVFSSGARVPFAGTAMDHSSVDISTEINWYLNDEASPFATGASASLDFGLVGDGIHTITAQATDANGTGSDAVTITVGNADVDNDGDGWTVSAGDCDDNDPQVNPGRNEKGPRSNDGKDNDCNGIIDG